MSKNILVADDSIVIQKSVGITFAQEDFNVKYVTDGNEALACYSQFKPDLILADVSMPQMGGVELIEKLKDEPSFQGTPIILMKGKSDDAQIGNTIQAGASDMILKPFVSTELLEKVHAALKLQTDPNKLAEKESAFSPEVPPFSSPISFQDDIEEPEIPALKPNPLENALEDARIPSDILSLQNETVSKDVVQLSQMPADAFDLSDSGLEDKTDITFADDDQPAITMVQDDVKELNLQEVEDLPDQYTGVDSPKTDPAVEALPIGGSAPQREKFLTDQQIKDIVTQTFQNVIERIAWEVVPEMAERIIKEEIQRLTREHEGGI